jgi:hypothetical protein
MKQIPGFPAYYVNGRGEMFGPRGKMSIGRTDSGYSRVTLYDSSGARKTLRMSRIVLLTFRGPCPSGHEAAHDNGVKNDDRLANLTWKTTLANHADKQRHGTTARGERHGLAKLDAGKVTQIRASHGATDSALARQFGVSRPVIKSVRERRTWRHL